jgi:hypothetical protein
MLEHHSVARRTEAVGACAVDAALSKLADPNHNLAILRRKVPRDAQRDLGAWARGKERSVQSVFERGRSGSVLLPQGLPSRTLRFLKGDVGRWLDTLARFASVDRLRYFLGRVDTDRCSKFHVDYVRYRLMATYVGPGTEWIPNELVHRPALDYPPECSETANSSIVKDLSGVQHARTDEVLILKGRLGGLGAVHRSPHISGSGQVRFVMIASTIEDPA